MRRSFITRILGCVVLGGSAALAWAQPYPSKPVKILVPFVAGGTSDIVARAVSQKLNEAGYTTVVENRPGANGSIAGEALAKSPNDGYTLLVGSIGTFAINMGLYKNAKYDVLRDFDAITVAVRTPNVLIVPPNFPANNLKEFIEYARKNRAIILFDSAYEAYIRDPKIPHSIYEIEGARECAIEFRSFSKNGGFTGLRCAFTVVPKTLLARTAGNEWKPLHPLWLRRQTTKFNGVAYIIQRAAEAQDSEARIASEVEQLKRNGFDRLIRLAVGMEDPDDLIAALNWTLHRGAGVTSEEIARWQHEMKLPNGVKRIFKIDMDLQARKSSS